MIKTIKLFHTLLFVLILQFSWAQNGKLLSQQPVVFPDSLLSRLEADTVFTDIQTNSEVFSISYQSDDLKINGYMAVPKKPGDYPVIIFNRGGNRDFGALNDSRAFFLLGSMASWGYVVVASNYRGGGGSEGMEEFGGREVNDILNLIPLLADEPKADTSRMGIYGFSRGGMMTYILLRQSCAFKAAVVGAGPTDLAAQVAERPVMETRVIAELVPDYYANKEAELRKRSAIHWPDELCKTTPLMIMHGSADWRVSPKESLNLVAELYALKHPVRFLFLEGAQHSLAEFRPDVQHNIRSFFDYYVKSSHPWPDMEPHGN